MTSSAFLNISSILCSAFEFCIAGAILSLHSLVDSAFHFTPIHFSVPDIPYLSAVSERRTGAFHVSASIFFALVAGESFDDWIFCICALLASFLASDPIILSASCAVGFMAVL